MNRFILFFALLAMVLGCANAWCIDAENCSTFVFHPTAKPTYAWQKSPTTGFSDCIRFYETKDTDGDGIADWTSRDEAGGALSRVLVPLDDDIDGDGVENLLDPAPFDAKIKNTVPLTVFPPHLLDARADVARLQSELFVDFGILAINNTDRHSAVVLEELAFLLRSAFPVNFMKGMKNFHALYAFRGHDARMDLAAFHLQSHAISVGGERAYAGRTMNAKLRAHLLATLAHEIGHAFLFESVTPLELERVSREYGEWGGVFGGGGAGPLRTLFALPFFAPHPLYAAAAGGGRGNGRALASEYSARNIHEWFADSFAAVALNALGEKNLLGADWKKNLNSGSEHGYWVDYANVSPGFADWLKKKMVR